MQPPDNYDLDKPVNQIMSREIQPNAKQRKQAESFHRVLIKKGYTRNGKVCVLDALMKLVKKD